MSVAYAMTRIPHILMSSGCLNYDYRRLEVAKNHQETNQKRFVIDLLKHCQKRTCRWEAIQIGEDEDEEKQFRDELFFTFHVELATLDRAPNQWSRRGSNSNPTASAIRQYATTTQLSRQLKTYPLP